MTGTSTRRPAPPPRRDLRKPLLIGGAVLLVAVVGFGSTRLGPLRLANAGDGPLALPAPGASASAAPSPSAPVDLGEDVIYPDPVASPVVSASPQPSSSPAATSAVPKPRWSRVIDEMTALRVAVFERPDAADLSLADRPGSPAYRNDDAARALLAAQNLRARGLRFALRTVNVVRDDGAIVSLDVVDTVGPYDIVDARGSVVEHRAGRGAKRWSITIRKDQGRWRFVEITAATKGR